MHMEKIGDMFFSILLDSNLLQDAKKDEYGKVLSCEMHDLVHYLVQSLSRSKTLRLTESRRVNYETFPIQYLALEGSGEEMPFPSAKSFKSITTLFLLKTRLTNDRQLSFFMLRVLNLTSSGVQELPTSIGKLTHLRYLDLSGTSIKILPESLCQLYNLQTLRVRNCYLLTKFPFNFKNLVNLRHFDLDLFMIWCKSSVLMPLEIGQLHLLQTLPFFNVGEEKGRQIEELKSLENLCGRLEIRNLELVKNKEEAKSANLIRKPNIDELRLSWNAPANQRKDDNDCNQVLEGLQPHQNLKGLIIERFFGDQLSTWMEKLDKLVKFELINCKNCKELPTLGHMPSLRSLHLEGLDGITSIGPSFYGGSAVHSGSSNRRPIKLFPALEHFILRDMLNLTEWMEVVVHGGTVEVFPNLETIKIYKCPLLTTFPNHFPHLKELDIKKTNNGSAIMTYICSSVSTLTSFCIWNVNELTELPNMLFQNNPNLVDLELRECRDLIQFELSQPHTCIDNNATLHLVGLESLEKLVVQSCHSLNSISIPRGHRYLTALRRLSISRCNGLTQLSIPQISESEWDSTSSPFSSSRRSPPLPLEELYVFQCPNLMSFPIDFTRTPSLSSLDISQCERLTNLPKGKLCSLTSLRRLWIGPFSQTTELHSFLDLFDAGALQPLHYYFPSLSELIVYGWLHWESLPKQLQHLSALSYLYLNGFGVKSLPDWFGKLSSLEQLWLHKCEKLENLSSYQSMRNLTKLSELRIQGCPLLEERCKSKSSSTDPNSESSSSTEWSKISHIPYLSIDKQLIRD